MAAKRTGSGASRGGKKAKGSEGAAVERKRGSAPGRSVVRKATSIWSVRDIEIAGRAASRRERRAALALDPLSPQKTILPPAGAQEE
jgi:hypothetical protein